MTQFSDDLFLGSANFGGNGSYGFPNNGFGRTSFPFAYGGLGIGPMGRDFNYDITPLTKNAANLAASQSPGSAALVLSAAAAGVTAIVDATGVTRYTFDVARCVTVTSGGVDTGITFLIKGYDIYDQPMSQVLTGASGAAATTTKAFYSVISIVPSGAVASTVTAGTSDVLGLPISLIDKAYVTAIGWANTVGNDAGTLTTAVLVAATTTTGDTRGTYQPSSATNGTNRLVFVQTCPGTQAGPSATAAAVLGVQQV